MKNNKPKLYAYIEYKEFTKELINDKFRKLKNYVVVFPSKPNKNIKNGIEVKIRTWEHYIIIKIDIEEGKREYKIFDDAPMSREYYILDDKEGIEYVNITKGFDVIDLNIKDYD